MDQEFFNMIMAITVLLNSIGIITLFSMRSKKVNNDT